MAVQIPTDVQSSVEERVASGRYQSDADVMRAAFAALEAQERRVRLQAAIAEGARGERIPLTPELWNEIERAADEADRLGLPLNPHVCP